MGERMFVGGVCWLLVVLLYTVSSLGPDLTHQLHLLTIRLLTTTPPPPAFTCFFLTCSLPLTVLAPSINAQNNSPFPSAFPN
ncbi:hypothetical protein BO94DRAFT_134546 [Aspergillus sclerotioniger CBS 115572]|uniref:Secreted peptide n=1 Tax=Aspergillus sclerotioniger CBS 115572 TaxID=1450535 RepID=A0A317XBE4_9EURO|nr:hypothetical protein BO94DRAFT_134546 [Aspergillus sclerotioniger CBS 115572]PWY95715.1 hypothetical protein BO94DRAFT_134546 [Aspergillus sclerotioniger CBS 115572]